MTGDEIVEALMIHGYVDGNVPCVDKDGRIYAIAGATVIDGVVHLCIGEL